MKILPYNTAYGAVFKSRSRAENHTDSIKTEKTGYSNPDFVKLSGLIEKSMAKLKQAEKDSECFTSQGRQFRNISEHKVIATNIMKNSKGQDFWLEFSSTKERLSYLEYGPLRNLVEKNSHPKIKIVTLTKNPDSDDIESKHVLELKKDTSDDGTEFISFTSCDSHSFGAGISCFENKKEQYTEVPYQHIDKATDSLEKFLIS